MDIENKNRIIEFNRRFGLETKFIRDENVLGYCLGRTVYINEVLEHDAERTNKHEVLHFFEETEEFEKLKKELLKGHSEDIDEIRRQYELRYYGVYSEDEIEAGVLDNEIVIDMLIDNSVIEYEDGLRVGDRFLGNIERGLEQKRYLNLTLNNNIKQMNLSQWEKIFVVNYYDGKEHKLSQTDKEKCIREDIEKYLKSLYEMREEEFEIDPHSPEVIRHFNGEIEALKKRGEDVSYLLLNKEESLRELAETFSKKNYEGYKHIVDLIKGLKYEPAFKAMMLRETLSKVYKLDREDDKRKTIVKKRDMHKSIAEHMILNQETLDIIYKNIGEVDKYQNFANLYFAAVAVFNKKIAEKSGIKLDGVDTYGKGRWIKFEGKTSNKEEYLKNAEKLSALVQNTPWCTKELASSQLAQGDFYVFVDNNGEPHIAVKMSGNEIDEVRGVKNGNAQELEEEYRDVAISFLENNKELENGKEWLEKEEWNKRLIEYRRKIDEGTFTKEDVPQFIEDYFRADFRSHGGENTNKTELKNRLEKIKEKLAEYYECREEEIHIGDIVFSDTSYKTVPYKLIFGNADFRKSEVRDLGQLQRIGGSADFGKSEVTDLGSLQSIGGDADFSYSEITDLGSLQSIGGDADFSYSEITDLGQLQSIGENADFCWSKVTDLDQLQSIGGNANFLWSKVTDLGALQSIGGKADFSTSQITDLGQLQSIGGDANFSHSIVTDLDQLQSIGGDADFSWSKLTSLGQLQSIGGGAYFSWSKVTSLGQLQSIGRYTDFSTSQITDLGQLQSIGGDADFSWSKLTSLGQLQSIGGGAYFSWSKLTSLGQLQSIGGYANFIDSQIKDLKNLKEIGGEIDWGENEDLKRQWEEIQARLKMEVDGQDFGKAGFGSLTEDRDEARDVINEALREGNLEYEVGDDGEE